MSEGRWIIWPATRFVPEKTLRSWLSDAIANEEVSFEEDINSLSLEEVCDILADAGIATFSKIRDQNDASMRECSRMEAEDCAAEYDPYGDDTPESPIY